MQNLAALTVLLLGAIMPPLCSAVRQQFTYSVPDNSRACFHEQIPLGSICLIKIKVVKGGNRDVDVELGTPRGTLLNSWLRVTELNYEWTAEDGGEFSVCLGNEFSSFTAKLVHFSLQQLPAERGEMLDGDEISRIHPRVQADKHIIEITESLRRKYDRLETALEYQRYYVLREAQTRADAERLNASVSFWSSLISAFMVLVGIGQVLVLRRFFEMKGPKKRVVKS